MHHKNDEGVLLLQRQGITFHRNYSEKFKYDQIHAPNPTSIRKIRNWNRDDCIKLYGPHVYQIMDSCCDFEYGKNEFYNCLSDWNKQLTEKIKPNIKCTTLPYPVNVEKFTPKTKTGKPVLYYKKRDPSLLSKVSRQMEISFKDYETIKYGEYKEDHYLEIISKAPFCVWLGCHESQGFAFQEAMSCNTPLFVIDVKNLREDYGDHIWKQMPEEYELSATSASYFDSRCGLITNSNSWIQDFQKFSDMFSTYNPRNFVLEELSPIACFKRFENLKATT